MKGLTRDSLQTLHLEADRRAKICSQLAIGRNCVYFVNNSSPCSPVVALADSQRLQEQMAKGNDAAQDNVSSTNFVKKLYSALPVPFISLNSRQNACRPDIPVLLVRT